MTTFAQSEQGERGPFRPFQKWQFSDSKQTLLNATKSKSYLNTHKSRQKKKHQ